VAEQSVKVINAKNPLENAGADRTWLDHWRQHSGQKTAICAVQTCLNWVEIGAQVLRKGADDEAFYVVPLCRRHALEQNLSLDISDKIKLVPLTVHEPELKPVRAEPEPAGLAPALPPLDEQMPELRFRADPAETAALLSVAVEPINLNLTCEALHELFLKGTQHGSLPVVQYGRPIGMVTRYDVIERFSRLYFRDLHGKESVDSIMDRAPLIVDQGLSLDELGLKVSEEGQRFLQDGFIITENGVYKGMGTGQALLRELTQRKEASMAAALERAMVDLRQAQQELLEKQRMQQELAIAQEIQTALLPKKLPQIPGYEVLSYYRPALEVGGDYFDFIALKGGQHAFAVADVAGKGVPGSLGMTMARTVIRAEAAQTSDPAETLRRANEIISPDLRSGMFITVFYCVLDPLTHRLTCACGGHNPAYHVSRAGVHPVAPEGMALGLGKASQYYVKDAALTLQPGELLALYTDGVTEAMNRAEDEYGEERFMASLARHQHLDLGSLLAHLIQDISDFTHGAPQTDDITLVLLRRDPAPS
jgi:serine phosphatase RsbU (regulator of sigma subunit)